MLESKQLRARLTREKILREATRLFTLKGFHDTKLDEVLQAAGVTSGAFFHHFASKEELAFAVMAWYLEERRQELLALERELPDSDEPLAGVFRWLDATRERFRQRLEQRSAGCIYGNLSTALCDTHEGFRQRLAEVFAAMAADFQVRLDQAVARGQPQRPIDTAALARYIVAVLEGSIILTRAHQDADCLAKHFDFLKEYLRQVFAAAGAFADPPLVRPGGGKRRDLQL